MKIIASEIDRFNRLGATWWNNAGPMRPLHVINELRLGYLRQLIVEQVDCTVPSNLEGLPDERFDVVLLLEVVEHVADVEAFLSAARRAGLALADLRGMRYLPVMHRASWVRDTSVNYIGAIARADVMPPRFTRPQH